MRKNLKLKFYYIFRTLTLKSKIVFLALLVLFVVSLFGLLHQLDTSISIEIPDKGGILKEGIIGTPRFVNPVLATSDADRDLTMLIYSGLLRVDEEGQLMPDLAESYSISEDGLCYLFTLNASLLWSDDKPITSDDIVFTLEQIKNPQTKSPKRAGWEGVEIEKINDKEIRFCLQEPYAPFLENAAIGIMPKHIWQDILPEQIPLSDYNISPIGSGPYKIEKISKNSSGIITSYVLTANKNFALKNPYIKNLILKFYYSEKKLIEAYQKGEIENLAGLSPKNILEVKKGKSSLKTYLMPRVFAVFFNQDIAPLFANQEVRKALNLSVDRKKIVKEVLQDFGTPLNDPIPPGCCWAISEVDESENFERQLEEAESVLKKAGWKLSEEGVLEKKSGKETTKLEFSISTSNMADLVQTSQLLKEMWEEIGAKVNIRIYEIGDLEQNVIRPRKYDTLLFGEIMGRDPDPFAFWHSSQRNDPGLNVSLYANITVDKLLEEARTLFDTEKRKEKYQEFQEEVRKDSPAVFLYSPHFIYLLPNEIKGAAEEISITIPSERFSQIYNWYIKTKKVWKIFVPN